MVFCTYRPRHGGAEERCNPQHLLDERLQPASQDPAYAAAKAAVSNLTQWLAVHFARVGIRVNAIAPGFLMTEQPKFLHIDQETGEYTLVPLLSLAVIAPRLFFCLNN